MIIQLGEEHIDEILALQCQCLDRPDLFLPTSRDGYLRAFRFRNFCLGYKERAQDGLTAFLNCSIPSGRAAGNLGRGRLPQDQLDLVGHMNTLLVDRGLRHRGIGRQLVLAAIYEFWARGARHIYVTASPLNAPSIKLLDALHFECVDTIALMGKPRLLFYRLLDAPPAQAAH